MAAAPTRRSKPPPGFPVTLRLTIRSVGPGPRSDCPTTKSPLVSGPSSNSAKPEKIWSGRRGSNPRPRPWQGRALPLATPASDRLAAPRADNGQSYAKCRPRMNSRRAVPAGLRPPELARKEPIWPLIPDFRMFPQGTRPPYPGGARDSSHFANQPRSVPVSSSRRSGSQSKVAHHSMKARSPSTTRVTRKVARKSVNGSDGGPQNSKSATARRRIAPAGAAGSAGPDRARS